MTGLLPPERRPNLLGIGAAKCGTTFFADVLSRHPDVFMPPQKELNALYYNDLADRLCEYEAHFRGAEGARVRCDFSVRYLHGANAPAAAAAHIPDTKILAILRDPVDQVQSHYWHQRRQNFAQPNPVYPVPDLFSALERFPTLLFEPALYAKHLSRWRSRFPDNRFYIIDYAEMRDDLQGVLARLWPFLDISPTPEPIAAGEGRRAGRQGVSPRGGVVGRIYPVLYTAVARGPYQRLKEMVGVRRMETLKRRLKLRQAAELLFFQSDYPKLDATGRARLRALFADDIASLAKSGFAPAERWRDGP